MKYLHIVLTLVIFAGLSVLIHEWGHFWACRLLGGEANITFDNIAQGWCHITELPDAGMWFVRLAGGMTVFVIYCVLWLLARWTPSCWDLDDELATVTIGVSHFIYAFFEAFASGLIGNWQMIFALLFAQVIVLILYAKELKIYFSGGCKDERR